MLKPYPEPVTGIGASMTGAEPGNVPRADDLQLAALWLYGAMPPPLEYRQYVNVGQIVEDGRRTLVWVASPNEVIDAARLQMVRLQSVTQFGEWDRITLLCWRIDSSIDRGLLTERASGIELLLIPQTLSDRLKKESNVAQLRGQVCFFSLQCQQVVLKPVCRVSLTPGGTELLIVTLDNYVPRLPESADLCQNCSDLPALMNLGPLALIEYWAIDVAYDGQAFRPVWQRRRSDAGDMDPPCVATQAVIRLRSLAGPRRLCVRVIDVFGYVSRVVVTVAALPSGAER